MERYAETEHGDVKRLTGAQRPLLRLRVGEYRVLFQMEQEDQIDVLRILHRREAYR
jgi:mRNA-degrading endonuclease RelE of RelBE toxin-antitoxin system